jgi:hypothetical protein
MSINSGEARLVLLCPAWKKWGTARTVKPGTVILHSREDDVVPFADSEELLRNSGLPATALVGVGNDHRLADPEPLAVMLQACEPEVEALRPHGVSPPGGQRATPSLQDGQGTSAAAAGRWGPPA